MINNKFEVGDKVICIDSSNCICISKTEIYIVVRIGESGYSMFKHINGYSPDFFYPNCRFKLWEPKLIKKYGIVQFCERNYK
jgi:hypothetical protein